MTIGFQSVNAQDTLQRNRIVSLSIASYADLYTPRWTLGYTQKISNRWWAGIQMGYGNFWLSVHGRQGDFLTKDYTLFEVRPAIFFDLAPQSRVKVLVSAEGFYINHKDHFGSEWYYDKSNLTYYEYDSADYKRIKTGANLNFNIMFPLGKRFKLWHEIGGGVRNRKVSFDNMINHRISQRYNDDNNHYDMFGIHNFTKNEGSYVGFNFNLGLKLAYAFQ